MAKEGHNQDCEEEGEHDSLQCKKNFWSNILHEDDRKIVNQLNKILTPTK